MSKKPESIETGSKTTDSSKELPKLNGDKLDVDKVKKYNLKRKYTNLDSPQKKSRYIPPIGNVDVFAEGIVPGRSKKDTVPETIVTAPPIPPPSVQSEPSDSTEFNFDLDRIGPNTLFQFTVDPMWPVFDPEEDVYLGPADDLSFPVDESS